MIWIFTTVKKGVLVFILWWSTSLLLAGGRRGGGGRLAHRAGLPHSEAEARREIITVRGQSYCLSSSKILTPHPPLHPCECVLPRNKSGGYTFPGRRGGGVGSIFWKTRDIGLPSYRNNLSTLRRINLPHQIAGLKTFEDKVKHKVQFYLSNYPKLKSRKFCIFLSLLTLERIVKERGSFCCKMLTGEAACDSVKTYRK